MSHASLFVCSCDTFLSITITESSISQSRCPIVWPIGDKIAIRRTYTKVLYHPGDLGERIGMIDGSVRY